MVYTSGMDKTQIRAELDALGVEYNPRLGEDKLMVMLDEARKKSADTAPVPSEPEASVVSAASEVSPEVQEEAPASTVVKIVDKFGFTVRTFSKEEHGDEFIELAQSFAQKKGLRIN